jgi:rare lipoprotein A
MTIRPLLPAFALLLLAGAPALTPALANESEAPPRTQRGEASYYADRFHGRQMANGDRFDTQSNAAASRTLPLGTVAEVTNLENGETRRVVIEDRGPYARGRIIDLSPRVAEELGMKHEGTAPVEVRPVGRLPNQARDGRAN